MIKYIIAIFISAVISYLLGSCNSSIITVKLLKGEDIRKFGSGNAGLTNTLRCFGKLPALFTLIGDLLKGVIAVFICKFICTLLDAGIGLDGDIRYIGYIACLFTVIGHIFPVYYGFKGGKGILIAAMCMLFADPVVFVCEAVVFFVLVGITKYISVGSLAACVGFPVFSFVVDMLTLEDKTFMPAHIIIAFAMGALCFARHWSNIERLRNHTENKFTIKKNKEV